ncbi:ROK family protein [Maritimibacter fusiformis]|uniref:N-acetylglucosamine kinase n=1 Tax=Maritimibacter fusiformis TaxID=2603819 RepID=A0A5D0RL74_9RHOB|nr:ROK family protein [Maritimibacter fusiformis]TYB82387.1 ROK family protein [Maritimibacter fusiformis]
MGSEPMLCGGIDIGGTKIEARLFRGAAAETVEVRRIATPKLAFVALLEAIVEQVRWLESLDPAPFPIGLSLAGVIDPETGIGYAANIPVTGYALGRELGQATGRDLPIVNDCMAFAFSEANGGAGDGARSVMGLILGTGVGGGICIDGQLPHRHGGLAVEIGHLGLPAQALARHDLPLFKCGCGREGCMETCVSGTGIANLAEWRLGNRMRAEDLVAAGTDEAAAVLDLWQDLAGDCLYAIQIMLDPDRIVLGGGLSKLPDVIGRLTRSLEAKRMGSVRLPEITLARHGDSSGARGAALTARTEWPT